MSQSEHKAVAPSVVRCYVLTISDTRTEETDSSGAAMRQLLSDAGHQVIGHAITTDDPSRVASIVAEQIADDGCDVVITTGGTGLTSRDSTFEAIDRLLTKRLDGFGELFRMLSFAEIGPAAMLSRACAGVANRTIVAALPGSESAVRLALTQLLLPELGHLVQQARK